MFAMRRAVRSEADYMMGPYAMEGMALRAQTNDPRPVS